MINIVMTGTIMLFVIGMVERVVPIMLPIGISFVQIVNALTLTEELPLLAKTNGRQRNVKNKRRRGNAARKRLPRSAKKPVESVKTFHIVLMNLCASKYITMFLQKIIFCCFVFCLKTV